MRTDAVTMNASLVERRRIEFGLTLQDLSRRAGISDVTLRHARHGRPISTKSLRAIARAIRLPWKDVVSTFVGLRPVAQTEAESVRALSA